MSVITMKIGQNIIGQNIEGREDEWLSPEDILKSWDTEISYVQEQSEYDKPGLRIAQIGALFAIKSHWTVSNTPATIVMPTGTGKTETMLATMVSERCKKTLIVVPSKLLRNQTAKKSLSLGVLRKNGTISSEILSPSVCSLVKTPKNISELEDIFEASNVIVSTVALLKNFKSDYMKILSEKCSTVIIDEAHHIAANTWIKFKSNFTNSKCLQFTATPFRNDGKKIDGKIIYNFPLSKAQEYKYFQPISFLPIYEFDEDKSDNIVAKKAVEVLELDIKNSLPHIILVRAKNKKRAEFLFEDVYKKKYAKYKPVLIISGISEREKKDSLRQIELLESRILVCVDMFGEGIDIPNLKIAAIHDKYKSLPITLQFVGRFARTQIGLGHATVIANIANEEVGEALSELYSQDSDWNELLHIMSDQAIGRELSLQ